MTRPDRFTTITAIIREQNWRTGDDTGAARGLPPHHDMTDNALDDALDTAERDIITAMRTTDTDPARHDHYADAMRTALADFTSALTRADAAVRPGPKALAACDLERHKAYINALIAYPTAHGLLSALTVAEGAVRRMLDTDHVNAPASYLQAVDEYGLEVTAAEVVYDAASLCIGAYSAFLVSLPEYHRLRRQVSADDASAAVPMSVLAGRIDRARADLAKAFVQDRSWKARRSAMPRTSAST